MNRPPLPGSTDRQPRRWSSGKTERVTINDAERIVAHRRRNGRIKGPEDPIGIDGVLGATARTIAGQVDFG